MALSNTPIRSSPHRRTFEHGSPRSAITRNEKVHAGWCAAHPMLQRQVVDAVKIVIKSTVQFVANSCRFIPNLYDHGVQIVEAIS
jgi:hypothetical protein